MAKPNSISVDVTEYDMRSTFIIVIYIKLGSQMMCYFDRGSSSFLQNQAQRDSAVVPSTLMNSLFPCSSKEIP